MSRSGTLGKRARLPRRWRVVLLFTLLALVRGVVYAALIPPWQSPDEHGHFEYAWLVSQHGPLVGPEAISPEFQQRVLESMARFDYWRLTHQPTPEVLPTDFSDSAGLGLLLTQSAPQVGDERPLYYLLVGGLLGLAGDPGVLAGMYIGRGVSVLLFAAAVGLTALATQTLFPGSLFMRIVPPVLVLSLPMLGEMGAAVNSDATGVLTGTLFFASLIPVFCHGLTWRRSGAVVGALALALLSKKTTLFLVPTALLALLVYAWTRGVRLSRWARLALGVGALVLAAAVVVLALVPGGDAAGWLEWESGCGATRVEEHALHGEAALRVGTCADGRVAQALSPQTVETVAGQTVTLNGWVRSATGPAMGLVSIWDSENHSQKKIAVGETWQQFVLTHTVDVKPQWVAVRLGREGSGGAILFDDMVVSTGQEHNLLLNGSAETRESLLRDLLGDTARRLGAPRRFVERMLDPRSWSRQAMWGYARAAHFCLQTFWGHFGWLALPLPPVLYRALEVVSLVALVSNVVFLASRPGRSWQNGYLLVLIGGGLLLVFQALLPLVSARGTPWLPQGRYLFPGVFAIAVLIAWGFHRLLPSHWQPHTVPAAVGMMVGFDLLCLGYLIVPYFHARG